MVIAVDFGFFVKPISRPATSFPTWVILCICSLSMILVTPLWIPSDAYCLTLVRIWQAAMQFCTQPVLFCLVNIVILFIWVSSGSTDYNSACDPIRKEELQHLCAPKKDTSQKVSSSYKESLVMEFPSSCSAKDHTSHSEEFSDSVVLPASSNWVDLKTCEMECFTRSLRIEGDRENAASASEALCTDHKEQSSTDIVKENSACSKECNSEMSNSKSNKATQTIRETKKAMSKPGTSVAAKRAKFESRSASFPNIAPSRVVVRNMSMSKAHKAGMKPQEIVMEKDELNERIEAFFARFREQLRRESLSNPML